MVLCAGRLDAIVPLEPATMPGRVVVQWDKDDSADLGIVKVDLLGLGMMAVLEDALVMCRVDRRVVRREMGEIHLAAGRAAHHERVLEDGHHPEAQEVHLHDPEVG